MTQSFGSLEWRNIGPHRGGRVGAVAGHPTKPMLFYFGSTGGGVWKTTNGGTTWQNISDGYFKTASVGAIALSQADPNVLYVGMGESNIRGNVTHGDGVYKSTDGGQTWTHLGLEETRQISKIVIHPANPDLVYVAAFGHAFGPNPERGIYRSKDGGKSWEQVLTRGADAGAIDLVLDPTNPRILYTAFWEARRSPWSLVSGGPGTGLFKSTDGGDTWVEITGNPGIPEGVKGKIGLAVSPAKPNRVWALIEHEEGGLFRSDDSGATWSRVSDDRNLRSRAWYYTHVFADPQDAETVYVLNTFFWKSNDGGKSWGPVATPHPDHHGLWIDPQDPQRMINGNDGGACVSFDGGLSWSTVYNQPTAEMYHVTTDSRFPYRVYGAQQDNTTLCVASRTPSAGLTEREWYNVGGAESGYIAVRQDNPDIVFAGSSGGGEGGRITRYDHKLGQVREVSVWPEKTAGLSAAEYTYRFQWTSPLHLSPHDQNVLYSCGNHVFRSFDEGESWECISPDLTRNDKEKQAPSGGPITKDHTGVEVYCTIFAFAESPVKQGLLWAGSDDGLIHLSQDDGKSWTNVTPKGLPEWARVSIIDPSHHDPAVAYVAANRYQLDDLKPYLFKTSDYGQTWTQITSGIPENEFARVIRQDPVRPGLLYAGTEKGAYVSFNDGQAWESLSLNLPVVPVHDIVVKENDLVAATHGRSFWILDDVTPLRQVAAGLADGPAVLFQPRDTVRFRSEPFLMSPPGLPGPFATIELPSGTSLYLKAKPEGGRAPQFLDAGQNPHNGVVVHFNLKEKPEGEVKLTFLQADGTEIRSFSTKAEDGDKLKVTAGPNRFIWNMEYPGAEGLPDPMYKMGYECAPLAVPGGYKVRLEVAGQSYEQPFQIVKDPRVASSQEDLEAQFALVSEIRDKVSQLHKVVKQSRSAREQLSAWVGRIKATGSSQPLVEQTEELVKKLSAMEGDLIQTKWKSMQDTLNFPPGLNAKVAHLAGIVATGDYRPTKPMYALFAELSAEVAKHCDALQQTLEEGLTAFEKAVRESAVPLVSLAPSK